MDIYIYIDIHHWQVIEDINYVIHKFNLRSRIVITFDWLIGSNTDLMSDDDSFY